MTVSDRFEQGLAIRREVLGDEYVDGALDVDSEFEEFFQSFITEMAWGTVWSRPGLPRPTRSLLCIAMMAALGRRHELATHVRGALNTGCSMADVEEVLLQVAVYCGLPAGVDGLRVVRAATASGPTPSFQ